jgi:PKD repeat protein
VLNSTTTGVSVNPSATNVVITNAVLTGTTILGTSTTITNSSVGNTTIQDAVITNNVIQSGIITLPSGSTTVVVTPTSVAQLINLPPVVSFVAVVSGGLVTVTDSSTDANATTSPYLSDSWTYTINYGDGVTVTVPASSLGGSFNHTYTSSGTYTVTTTITDAYGAVTTKSTVITVTVPIISGGGGGGGYYTGGYFVTTPELTSTSSTAHLNTTNATGTVKAYTFNRSLTVGSKGSDVMALQEILRYYGFFSYPVSTGYYGPITKEAVAKFQKVYSISPVSGTVGPKTREILKLLQIPQEILKKLVEYTYEKPSISTGVLLKQTNENPQLINAVKTDKEKPSVIKRVINLFNNLFGK